MHTDGLAITKSAVLHHKHPLRPDIPNDCGRCRRNAKALQRVAVQKADEWSRITALQMKLAELKGAPGAY